MFIQFIWILLPASLFLFALYNWVDSKSRKGKSSKHSNFLFKQAIFVFFAVIIAFAIDEYLLDLFLEKFVGDIVTRILAQILLLPSILYLLALLVGSGKPVYISSYRKKAK
jgi:hypothetical protein